ncbi:hypothetical protein RDABS01_009182 [Bienertia sinuspersici]
MENMDSLFDAILICILSLLPTKVTARTSVLSKRWQNLWTRVIAVEFELTTLLYYESSDITYIILREKSFDSIAMLIKSCLLLETLKMTLEFLCFSQRISIVAPNLKSLSLIMVNIMEKHQVIIDAPKLIYLFLVDRGSARGLDADDFVGNVSKLFVKLSSVREFHLESNVKIFSYMHSVNSLQLFGNLSYATTTLTRRSGVIDFLLFLQIAPNLKEVSVTLNYEECNPLADITQSVVVVPEFLLNNLECVNITGLYLGGLYLEECNCFK